MFLARPRGFRALRGASGALPLHPTAFVKAGETFFALRALYLDSRFLLSGTGCFFHFSIFRQARASSSKVLHGSI